MISMADREYIEPGDLVHFTTRTEQRSGTVAAVHADHVYVTTETGAVFRPHEDDVVLAIPKGVVLRECRNGCGEFILSAHLTNQRHNKWTTSCPSCIQDEI